MIFIVGIVLLLILLSLFSRYYFVLLKRIYVIYKDDVSKRGKRYLILLSIILSLLTVNAFSLFGLFLIHFVLVSLIFDFFYAVGKMIIKRFNHSENNFFKKLHAYLVVPLILTIVVFGYGYINIRNVISTNYDIYTNKEIGEDLRILLITDIHYGTIFGDEKLEEYQKKLDKVNADIVVLGGDIVDESTSDKEMKNIFNMLGKVKNKYGIYYVTGNHDEQQYSGSKDFNKEELDQVIANNKIEIIDERSLMVRDNVVIAGRKDYSYGSRSEVESILKDVDRDNFIIMVDHQPIEYDENIDAGVDLILSGHTHAGQVFPIKFFINFLHTADLAYGHKTFGKMEGIVSSGMAGWGYPIRTEEHSEYVVIDVKER